MKNPFERDCEMSFQLTNPNSDDTLLAQALARRSNVTIIGDGRHFGAHGRRINLHWFAHLARRAFNRPPATQKEQHA